MIRLSDEERARQDHLLKIMGQEVLEVILTQALPEPKDAIRHYTQCVEAATKRTKSRRYQVLNALSSV